MSDEASESPQGQRLTEPPDGGAAPTRSIDAFISYASSDASIADSVVHALEKQGLRCWIAPRDVVPGALYADGIARAINGAKVFVLVLSEHAVASPHVGKEIERASSKRRPIIALHTDSAPLTPAFEYFLSESQWIDVRPGSIEAAAAKLVEGIRRHLDASAAIEAPIHSPKPTPSRGTAIPRPKWLVAGGVAVVLLASLAYFVVDHFRPSKHEGTDTVSPKDRVAPGAQAEKPNTTASAPPAASIAVLAFSDLSAEGNQGYFSDGIAEEILNVLAHVNGLKVASRTSSFQFRKSELGAPAIAQKLGVRHILEGSVRKAGGTVRVTAQLIDASTDQHLWSQNFDRPLTTANLFAIQDEIASAIVAQLTPTIGGTMSVGKPIAAKAGTADVDVYDLYLKGRSLFIARTKDNLSKAARVLRAALAKDPKFARAWETLGAVLVVSEYWGLREERDYQQAALDAADQALRLDPSLSIAYAVRGRAQLNMQSHGSKSSWDESLANLAQAIGHDPQNTTAFFWRGADYQSLGFLERATEDLQHCLDLDPAYEICRRYLAMNYLALGRTDAALGSYEVGMTRAYWNLDAFFAPAAAARGERLGVLGMLAQQFPAQPQVIQPIFRALTDPRFNERDRQEALALVDRGNTDDSTLAALWILRSYDEMSAINTDNPSVIWLGADPAWLKSAGRKKMMLRWRLPEYWRQHGFPPQCRPIAEADFECR